MVHKQDLVHKLHTEPHAVVLYNHYQIVIILHHTIAGNLGHPEVMEHPIDCKCRVVL